MIGSMMALAAAATLQPTGKWVVDFDDNACVLSRQYGTAEQGLVFLLKAPLVGKQYEIIIATPERKPKGWEFEEGWIEKPDGRRIEPINVANYSTVNKQRLSRFHVDPELYVVGEDGERLILHFGKTKTYDLALPGLEKAMAVLDVCLKDLRKIYGVDEKILAEVATPANTERRLYGYFSSVDYPTDAIRNGQQGIVGALFWVEANGRVKECQVVESSQSKALDDQTCRIIVSRARFKPALNAAGQAIRSPEYQRIRWLLP